MTQNSAAGKEDVRTLHDFFESLSIPERKALIEAFGPRLEPVINIAYGKSPYDEPALKTFFKSIGPAEIGKLQTALDLGKVVKLSSIASRLRS